MVRKHLFKYRSLDNFEFFVDILLNQRLFATSYENMNDAMEGIYYNFGLPKQKLKDIKENKDSLKICSLSQAENDPLLWAHYANGSRGVNLEVEITGHDLDIKEISYDGVPTIKECINTQQTAKEILTHKHESWKYEQEVRVFTTKQYVKIKIIRIILGEKISREHKELISSLVKKIYKDEIPIINKTDID